MVFLCSCGGLIWENRVHVCGTRRCSCGGLQFEGMIHCCGYKPDYSTPPTDYELWRGWRSLDEWVGSPKWGKRSPSLFGNQSQETTIFNSQTIMDEIKNIQQTGLFQEYCNSFDSMLNNVILSEDYATTLFVRGLKSEIRNWVQFLRPKTLEEAYEKANNYVKFLAIFDSNKELKRENINEIVPKRGDENRNVIQETIDQVDELDVISVDVVSRNEKDTVSDEIMIDEIVESNDSFKDGKIQEISIEHRVSDNSVYKVFDEMPERVSDEIAVHIIDESENGVDIQENIDQESFEVNDSERNEKGNEMTEDFGRKMNFNISKNLEVEGIITESIGAADGLVSENKYVDNPHNEDKENDMKGVNEVGDQEIIRKTYALVHTIASDKEQGYGVEEIDKRGAGLENTLYGRVQFNLRLAYQVECGEPNLWKKNKIINWIDTGWRWMQNDPLIHVSKIMVIHEKEKLLQFLGSERQRIYYITFDGRNLFKLKERVHMWHKWNSKVMGFILSTTSSVVGEGGTLKWKTMFWKSRSSKVLSTLRFYDENVAEEKPQKVKESVRIDDYNQMRLTYGNLKFVIWMQQNLKFQSDGNDIWMVPWFNTIFDGILRYGTNIFNKIMWLSWTDLIKSRLLISDDVFICSTVKILPSWCSFGVWIMKNNWREATVFQSPKCRYSVEGKTLGNGLMVWDYKVKAIVIILSVAMQTTIKAVLTEYINNWVEDSIHIASVFMVVCGVQLMGSEQEFRVVKVLVVKATGVVLVDGTYVVDVNPYLPYCDNIGGAVQRLKGSRYIVYTSPKEFQSMIRQNWQITPAEIEKMGEIERITRNSTLICAPIMADTVDLMLILMNMAKTSGADILRGWCENLHSFSNNGNFFIDQKALWPAAQKKALHAKGSCKNDNTMIFFFEVEDTGCGIDPSKWESVFESFEQADPSTTRLHGGTSLGLCLVRTLVNKMGGEIRVVTKSGSGTLMQLYLLLRTPTNIPRESYQLKFAENNLKVVLALGGRMGKETPIVTVSAAIGTPTFVIEGVNSIDVDWKPGWQYCLNDNFINLMFIAKIRMKRDFNEGNYSTEDGKGDQKRAARFFFECLDNGIYCHMELLVSKAIGVFLILVISRSLITILTFEVKSLIGGEYCYVINTIGGQL